MNDMQRPPSDEPKQSCKFKTDDPAMPHDQYDAGTPPAKEVSFRNLNDKISKDCLENMCKAFGKIEETKIYYNAKNRKHMGIGKVVFTSAKAARSCAEKLNGTSKMGNVMQVLVDTMGKKRQQWIHEILKESLKSSLDPVNSYLSSLGSEHDMEASDPEDNAVEINRSSYDFNSEVSSVHSDRSFSALSEAGYSSGTPVSGFRSDTYNNTPYSSSGQYSSHHGDYQGFGQPHSGQHRSGQHHSGQHRGALHHGGQQHSGQHHSSQRGGHSSNQHAPPPPVHDTHPSSHYPGHKAFPKPPLNVPPPPFGFPNFPPPPLDGNSVRSPPLCPSEPQPPAPEMKCPPFPTPERTDWGWHPGREEEKTWGRDRGREKDRRSEWDRDRHHDSRSYGRLRDSGHHENEFPQSLMKPHLNQPRRKPPGTTSCGGSKCRICKYICRSIIVQGPRGHFTIQRHFTCDSCNLVYVIRCTLCHILYIGETERTLRERFKEHLRDIRLKDFKKTVARHFNKKRHTVKNIRIKGLWLVRGDVTIRKKNESYFIKRLGTKTPLGLNQKL